MATSTITSDTRIRYVGKVKTGLPQIEWWVVLVALLGVALALAGIFWHPNVSQVVYAKLLPGPLPTNNAFWQGYQYQMGAVGQLTLRCGGSVRTYTRTQELIADPDYQAATPQNRICVLTDGWPEARYEAWFYTHWR